MFSESCSSFCFMGISSNSKVFLSDKDLKGTTTTTTTTTTTITNNNNIMDQEVGLLVIPTMEKIHKECQTQTQEDHHHQLIRLKQLSVQEQEGDHKDDHHQEEQKQHSNIIVTNVSVSPLNLKIEIPSNVRSENDDDDDDDGCSNEGFKTPTSSDHKIPVILECPGAPKKTKSKLVTKRKACRRRIVLDLSTDLESLFPMPYVINKRVKQCSGTDSKTCHKGMR